MRRNDDAYIQHIMECLSNIKSFLRNRTKEEFMTNTMLSSAVIHQFMIMGEAANKVPRDFKENHPHIPWREMIATRNKLIHEYFGVDLDELWKTIEEDLSLLEKLMEQEGLI